MTKTATVSLDCLEHLMNVAWPAAAPVDPEAAHQASSKRRP
ncbi:hypothetical protein AAGW05_10090 [Arthrobacter sp. LAPM80]